ncbi:hypothetical protein PTSG_13023 [Salpingoeca rosetta]|uniref:SAM domain-containing protein n=1 Tax=Salpingoeca rosetta (strain ATCC 50818 / BSB-021) TaxID=946362 RepID=F2UQZ0_SALR5|nr:uncharacterized protein PTSG_13023 [Salpingoeca rosetta]EGD80045.1 hypothetical protein PTSG_13023 [Salpingoeca rosetta]|eukprot:XP_004988370.1 hypothetical protein PTSG_13023 [Salpingoeca rosetta]
MMVMSNKLLVAVLACSCSLAFAFYTADLHIPLEEWDAEEVQHWLVSIGLSSIVPTVANLRVNGALLKTWMDTGAYPRELGLSDIQTMNLQLHLDSLAHASRAQQAKPSASNGWPYLHPCQFLSSSDCLPGFGMQQIGLLLLPRVTALMYGVDGVQLRHMPWKYLLTWLVAPHNAYFHYGLEAYGLSLGTILTHTLRVTAAAFGPVMDAAIVQACLGLAGITLSRTNYQYIYRTLPMIAHALSLAALFLDYYSGWYISSMRLMLALRDAYIVVGPAIAHGTWQLLQPFLAQFMPQQQQQQQQQQSAGDQPSHEHAQ